jgi:hypothetical protein
MDQKSKLREFIKKTIEEKLCKRGYNYIASQKFVKVKLEEQIKNKEKILNQVKVKLGLLKVENQT